MVLSNGSNGNFSRPCVCKRPRLIAKRRDIAKLIPHGLPGIRIDGIVACSVEERTASGLRTIRASDCRGHFDRLKGLDQIVPSGLLIEMGYQVGLYLFSQLWPGQIAVPISGSTTNPGFALLGETVLFETRLIVAPGKKMRTGTAVLRAWSANTDKAIIEHEFTFATSSYELFARAIRMANRHMNGNGASRIDDNTIKLETSLTSAAIP